MRIAISLSTMTLPVQSDAIFYFYK